MPRGTNPALWDNILYKPSGVWTKSYTSSDQTITLAGSLTLAHSMGVIPRLLTLALVCQTAEGGYSIGDVLFYQSEGGAGTNRGLASVVVDTTNINIRYASAVAQIPRKDTGVQFDITAANWKLRIYTAS